MAEVDIAPNFGAELKVDLTERGCLDLADILQDGYKPVNAWVRTTSSTSLAIIEVPLSSARTILIG